MIIYINTTDGAGSHIPILLKSSSDCNYPSADGAGSATPIITKAAEQCLSACLSPRDCLSLCLSVRISLSVCLLSVALSVCLSIYPSIRLSDCLSI